MQEESGGDPRPTSPKALEGSLPAGVARPTLEEVQAYCQQRQNGIDPVRFYDYYAATGWKKHGQPIEDWKALLRTWESNDYARQTVPADTDPDDDNMNEYLSLVNRFMEEQGTPAGESPS